MLAQPEVLPSLLGASDADAIYGLLLEAERRLEPALAAKA
jgi:hypothetical protein